MAWLFETKKEDLKLLLLDFQKEGKNLLALLEADLELISLQKNELEKAITALKDATEHPDPEHLITIKSRLQYILQNLKLINEEEGKELQHTDPERTETKQLMKIVNDVLESVPDK